MARTASHQTCESYYRLDVNVLARKGLLSKAGTITWSRGDRVTGRICVHGDGNSVALAYVIDGQDIEERVQLEKMPVHFGGFRSWFLCPGCNRRVCILYGGKFFRCRLCHDLRYASQRESAKFRAISKIQRIRTKMGGSADLRQPMPCRPKYMHHRTYKRLIRQQREAWVRFEPVWAG